VNGPRPERSTQPHATGFRPESGASLKAIGSLGVCKKTKFAKKMGRFANLVCDVTSCAMRTWIAEPIKFAENGHRRGSLPGVCKNPKFAKKMGRFANLVCDATSCAMRTWIAEPVKFAENGDRRGLLTHKRECSCRDHLVADQSPCPAEDRQFEVSPKTINILKPDLPQPPALVFDQVQDVGGPVRALHEFAVDLFA